MSSGVMWLVTAGILAKFTREFAYLERNSLSGNSSGDKEQAIQAIQFLMTFVFYWKFVLSTPFFRDVYRVEPATGSKCQTEEEGRAGRPCHAHVDLVTSSWTLFPYNRYLLSTIWSV